MPSDSLTAPPPRRPVVGVMGPGETATAADVAHAEHLGVLIAAEGWITLTGGRPAGVMEAALRGAKATGGATIGVLPGRSAGEGSRFADVCVVTGLGEGRNQVNVLTSDVLMVCGMSAATASEVALALKNEHPVILVAAEQETVHYWSAVGGGWLRAAATPEHAVAAARALLDRG